MQIDMFELEAWIVAQYAHIEGIMLSPVSSEEEATRYVKCLGGMDILIALAKAINDKNNNAVGQAEAEIAGEEVLP
jgi:hypothetical protein